jgi:BASS family bile acid:Na+ symporter
MQEIDAIKINFDQDSLFIMNICLAFIMFGIALDLKVSDFKRVTKFPKPVLIGLSAQLLLLPVLTIILIHIWNPIPSMALGLLMVAACPGGNISNFAVHLSKGNTALSVTLTSIVTLLAFITTPLAFAGWAKLVPSTNEILSNIYVGPLAMFRIIFQLILVPLIIGMIVHYKLPILATAIKKPIRRISILLFFSFIVFALVENYENIIKYLGLVFSLVVIHNLIAMIAGYSWASAFKLPFADRKAICLETGIQNAGLGLVLILAFFNHLGGMLLVAAFWGIWDLLSSFLISMYWSRQKT